MATARVGSHHAVETAIARLRQQTAALAELQDQVGSGSRLLRPSLGPSEFVEVRSRRAGAARLETYSEAIADVTSTLDDSVSALTEAHSLLTRAGALASEAANASTDAEGIKAIAIEVDELIERMLAVANTQTNERYLYGGTATRSAPFVVSATDPAGRPTQIDYVGASDRGRGLVAPEKPVDMYYVGSDVFQDPAGNVFAELMALRDELRDPLLSDSQRSQALSARLGGLQNARATILDDIGEQSASLESMRAMTNRFGDMKLALDSRAGELDGTDVAAAVVRMGEIENLLKATIGVSSRLIDGSFLDFLR